LLVGDPVEFIDSSTSDRTISNWLWDLSNANLTGQEVNFTFSQADTFPVKLTVLDEMGCLDTLVKNVIIDPLPDVNFTSSAFCTEENTSFFNTSIAINDSIETATWSFIGLGTILTGDTVDFTFPNSGNNLIQLNITTKKGCEAIETSEITINSKPKSSFSLDENVGAPTFTISPENTSELASSYSWTIPELEISSNSVNPTFSFTEFGEFTLSLEAISDEGCTDTTQIKITVVDPVTDLILGNIDIINDDGLVNLQFDLVNQGSFELDSTILNIDFGGKFQSRQVIPNAIGTNETVSILLDEQFTEEQLNALSYICLTSNANETLVTETDLTNNSSCLILDTEFRVNDIFPQPVNESFNVNYFLPQTSDVTIELHNSMGTLLYSISKENLSPGPQKELIDISNLIDEFYILTVETPNKRIAQRITKL